MGSKGVGKSSIIKFFQQNRLKISEQGKPTIEVQGIPYQVNAVESTSLDADLAQNFDQYSGVFIIFDVSDKQTLSVAQEILNALPQGRKPNLVCLAHKYDTIVKMSKRKLEEKAVGDDALINFSRDNSLKIFKTSLQLPRLLNEAFDSMVNLAVQD